MLNENITKTRYTLAAYPRMEDRMVGQVIPEFWGQKDNIVPTCIDTGLLPTTLAGATTWVDDPSGGDYYTDAAHGYSLGQPVEVKVDEDIFSLASGADAAAQLATCQATEKTWFWDTVGSILYIHCESDESPALHIVIIKTLYGLTMSYKLCNRAIHQIRRITADGVKLVSGTDFIPDLVTATFTVLGSPLLEPDTMYWFVFETEGYVYGANDNIYMVGSGGDEGGSHAFFIDDGPPEVWDEQTFTFGHKIFGKNSLSEAEDALKVWWEYITPQAYYIKEDGAKDRFAQQFSFTGIPAFYLTKMEIFTVKHGTPTGNLVMKIYKDVGGTKTQVGTASASISFNAVEDVFPNATWTVRATPSSVFVDADGRENDDLTLMTNVADIIYDIFVNILGGLSVKLNAGDLAILRAARTEALAIFLDRETAFGILLDKLEASQLFKFVPQVMDEYTVKVAVAGEPVGTPHYRDEDLLSFSMERDWSSIFSTVKVKYDESAENQELKSVESSSTTAQYLYKRKDALTVETYLKFSSAALVRAADYIEILQNSRRIARFDVGGGNGFSLMPMDKVKITRSRADYVGGTLDGILFRVFEIVKNPETGVSSIVAVLDSQTYPS